MESVDLSLPLRFAILEYGTPLPNKKASFQGCGGVFEYMLRAGAKSLG